jgi:hypothetical protein
MNQALKQSGKSKIKIMTIAANAVEQEIEWMGYVLFNNLKLPSGLIIKTKKYNHG